MLDTLRNASKNWLGKSILFVLFSLLIFSFAVWGIGDIFRGFGSGTVAKAGKVEIPTEDFRAEYQRVLAQMQSRLKRTVTNKEAVSQGIDKAVLNRMISSALVDEEAKKKGLALSSPAVAKSVLEDPRFRSASGTFDRIRFQQALSEAGLNEARYITQQRSFYLRQHLANSIGGENPVPKVMLEIIHRLATETRSVEFIKLTEADAGKIAEPSEADLKKYYAARKARYRAPEYRKVVVLSVTPDSIAKPDTITDEAAKKLYESVKVSKYTTAEKRQVQQIVFKPSESAAADAALAKIKAGTKFADVAKERKLKISDIELGTLAKKEFVDPAVANAAFAGKAGTVDKVIKGKFGLVLVNVAKIIPAEVKPFDAVKAELKKQLAETAAKDEVQKIYSKIEDERTSGKVLEDAAKAAGLKVRTIEALAKNGFDKKNQLVKNLPERTKLLAAVYDSDIGVDNDTINAAQGGYVWFEVAAIDAARDRKLEEVKDQVVKAWKDQEISKKLRTKADALVKSIKAGRTITEVAKAEKLKTDTAPDVKRTQHPKLPAPVVTRIFTLPSGSTGTAPGPARERFVFTIVDANTPPLTDKGSELARAETQLKQAYNQELFEQYVARLRRGLTVTYNPTALRNVLGNTN